MESIASWLARYGLEQYVASFIANDIDVDVLPSLSEKDLSELGVSMGHRKKFLAALLIATSSTAATRAATTSDTLSTSPEITAAGERRQLTVMFCDLVGSTALAEHLDPEDLREVIRAYQQCAGYVITRYDGHIAQYLGDGLLVYFGHPRAHEDDAERAVRAGLAIVSELNERMTRAPFGSDTTLAVRIGIHTGLIVIGEIGDSVRREQLALGDTPNIAARLQGYAEPGTIVISEHTRRLLAGNFVCADMGALAIKGIREPVRACTVTGERESASRFAGAKKRAHTSSIAGSSPARGEVRSYSCRAKPALGSLACSKKCGSVWARPVRMPFKCSVRPITSPARTIPSRASLPVRSNSGAKNRST